MSSLAFDKQGKPFVFHRRTAQLQVRVFKTPSARGTCSVVLGDDGEPLIIDPGLSVADFRKLVGYTPGLYRFDQCDEEGRDIDDAPPAYVSIDATRNAAYPESSNADPNPLLVIQQMAANQGEMMKAIGAQHADMLRANAEMLRATAEILRAPYRPAPVSPPTELRNADSRDDDDDDDDEQDETEDDLELAVPEHPLTKAYVFAEPVLKELGALLYLKISEMLQTAFSAKKVAAPVPAPGASTQEGPSAPIATPAAAPTESVVASSPSPSPSSAPPRRPNAGAPPGVIRAPSSAAPGRPVSPPAASPTVGLSDCRSATTATAPATTMPRSPAASGPPKSNHLGHLAALRERLSPGDREIAQAAVRQMDAVTRAQWLATLASMSVEEATEMVRSLIAEIRAAAATSSPNPSPNPSP